MSAVTGATVTNNPPAIDGNSPTLKRGYPTGYSTGGFTYRGVSTDGSGNVTIVLQTPGSMMTISRTADGAGEVFDPGSSGYFCLINIGRQSNQNWTVRARTSADGPGNGVGFSAGTGGGPGGL